MEQNSAYAAGPRAPTKGRGTLSNRSGRFERFSREPAIPHGVRDWTRDRVRDWAPGDGMPDGGISGDGDVPPLRTTVTHERPKRILTRNQSPDIPFDRSINPYRGCEHGCVYCYARPAHAYMGLSAGLDFESRLFAKPDAAALLRRELSRPGYDCAPIAFGTNTDPYQPIEKRYAITRDLLRLLCEAGHPATIVTKSHLIVRDLDILGAMAARGLVKVALSVTTLDRGLARIMEPRASTPQRRLDAIRLLSEAGVPTGVMVAPVIPAINDEQIETILAAAAHAGAGEAGYILLRLPGEVAGLFREWLETHFPDRASRVLSRLAALRGGRLNDPRFVHRMRGKGFEADLMKQRFEKTVRRLGLNRLSGKLRTDLFVPPAAPPGGRGGSAGSGRSGGSGKSATGRDRRQLSLF